MIEDKFVNITFQIFYSYFIYSQRSDRVMKKKN